MYPDNPNSVIPRSRAERQKLGMERSTSTRAKVSSPPEPAPVAEPEPDIVEELLQEPAKTLPPVAEKKTKPPAKKKAAKKPSKKKATARGKNVKVEELNQEELSDLFSGPTAAVDDDDDE